MKDETQHRQVAASRIENHEVQMLARNAIKLLAAGRADRAGLLDARLDILCDAFLSSDEDAHHETMSKIRQDGISGRDIIDTLIPDIARRMGVRWMDDEISFADVTIGAARLQEAVRLLSTRALHAERRPLTVVDAAPVLLIMPRTEHHTLGSFVAADQFRRLGYAVEIAIDKSTQQIIDMVRRKQFALVGITAGGRRTLATATELVEKIRTTVTRVTPIVIGGSVLEQDIDVLGITGADHIVRDALSALQACGLSAVQSGQLPHNNMDGHADGILPAAARVTT